MLNYLPKFQKICTEFHPLILGLPLLIFLKGTNTVGWLRKYGMRKQVALRDLDFSDIQAQTHNTPK